MSTLCEYYNTGDDGTGFIYGAIWKAQTFTPATAHKITSVKLKLYRHNLPGTVTVSIRATDADGKPTGSDLCSGTTDGDTLPTGSPYEWREITLGSGYNLSANTRYAIVVRAPSADGSNYLRWRWDGSSPTYAGGSSGYSSDSGSTWTLDTAYDLMFEDWGEPSATPKDVADTGSGVEAISELAVALSLADTGSGVDATPTMQASVPTVDTGVGADLISAIEAAFTLPDTGLGVDAVDVLYYISFINVSDVGSGADVISLNITIPTIEDVGVGTEAIIGEWEKLVADQGWSSEYIVPVTASMILSELASGTDAVAIQITPVIAETGTALESVTVAASLSVAEIGSGQESPSISATLTIPETGVGVDGAAVAISITVADTGQGLEAVLTRLVQLVRLSIMTRNKSRMRVQTLHKARMSINLKGGGKG